MIGIAEEAWNRLHLAEVEAANSLEASQTSTLSMKPVAVTRFDATQDGIDKINIPSITPPHIKRGNMWFDWAEEWYKRGATMRPISPAPGINGELALQNLVVVIRTKKLKPMRAIKCAAYLASLWFGGLERFDRS